jgi:hypothetical protein
MPAAANFKNALERSRNRLDAVGQISRRPLEQKCGIHEPSRRPALARAHEPWLEWSGERGRHAAILPRQRSI